MKVSHRNLINSCLGDTQRPCYLWVLTLAYMEMKVFLKANSQKKKKKEKKRP